MTKPGHTYLPWMLLGAAAVAGSVYVAARLARLPAAAASRRQALYYVDPMHPTYRSSRPGRAPDCGMELAPVYAGDAPPQTASTGPAPILLTASQEQALRFETETVELAPVHPALHTAGRVAPDEALTYRVAAGVDGWVRRVFSDATGTRVTRGQPLAAFYSKESSSPQQAYAYALDSYERLRTQPSAPAEPLALASQQLATARDNLQFLGMGETQIEQLGRTRGELPDIILASPADGWILQRNIAVGQRFMKGEVLYRIGSLERVWVLGEISPSDLELLGGVRTARILVDGQAALEGRVSSALPQFDAQGRSGKLRLEVDNPHARLVPGMIVDIEFDAPSRLEMTVPAGAVIDSGTTRHVFVAGGSGEYQVREVETGREEGDRIAIRKGLKPGDRVVTAGAFLLDSETRMRERR
ncbi:MAG TPA: efflux RND transporter periplasmic adaptor subunit [Candidatus Acidoferrales bacterium]|nr:efflux RND transporter periplasmic adaptor subunit [Candidatus Acidoferrales bacterium]